MYTFRRYKNTLGITDPDAGAGGEGFDLNGEGILPNSYVLRLYKYHLDISVISAAAVTARVAPALGWIRLDTFTMVPLAIAQDLTLVSFPAGLAVNLSYDHDFGPDGIEVYPPQPVGALSYALGVIDRGGLGPSAVEMNIQIEYGIDIDYRLVSGIGTAP